MNLALYYYLYSVYGNLDVFLNIILAVIVVVGVICFFAFVVIDPAYNKETFDVASKGLKLSVVASLVISIPLILMPSKKEVAIIVGLKFSGKGIERVIDDASEFYPLLRDVVKKELKDILKGGSDAK